MRCRDVETGRFVECPSKFRVTIGLNGLVERHVYKNFTATRFVERDEIETAKAECYAEVIKKGEEFLGYPLSEWWCGEFGEEVIEIGD